MSHAPGGQHIPEVFCWTRFGTEAAEGIDDIFERKERERVTAGVFYWGVGNDVGDQIRALRALTASPEVLFSPIKSRPSSRSVAPPYTLRWTAARDLDGNQSTIPSTVLVRSGPRESGTYFALICSSKAPLVPRDLGRLSSRSLRNLVSGRRLAGQQVTAVVRRDSSIAGDDYVIAMQARLVEPYFVYLSEPIREDRTRDDATERFKRLDERLRQAFIAGAEQDSRLRLGRGLTADELERVLRHYPGDL